jgi:hypothetical protein
LFPLSLYPQKECGIAQFSCATVVVKPPDSCGQPATCGAAAFTGAVTVILTDERFFSMAGLYDSWDSPEGEKIYSCTIITTNPNELMIDIHGSDANDIEY